MNHDNRSKPFVIVRRCVELTLFVYDNLGASVGFNLSGAYFRWADWYIDGSCFEKNVAPASKTKQNKTKNNCAFIFLRSTTINLLPPERCSRSLK